MKGRDGREFIQRGPLLHRDPRCDPAALLVSLPLLSVKVLLLPLRFLVFNDLLLLALNPVNVRLLRQVAFDKEFDLTHVALQLRVQLVVRHEEGKE